MTSLIIHQQVNRTLPQDNIPYGGSTALYGYSSAESAYLEHERTPGEVAVMQERQERQGEFNGQGKESPSASTCKTNSEPTLLSNILPWERRQLQGIRKPPGYRFFPDRQRETYARYIEWAMSQKDTHSLFGTYTFKNYVAPGKANECLNRHLGRMSGALVDAGGSQLKYFVATEWQRRNVVHFHSALIGHGLERLSRKRWELRWQGLSGGYARLYDADYGAAPYLAKYLNKSLGGELRVGGAWQGTSPPASLDPGPERWALE
ncbi:hypothetical protein ACFLT4_05445 [Chloroflexota bacterium]